LTALLFILRRKTIEEKKQEFDSTLTNRKKRRLCFSLAEFVKCSRRDKIVRSNVKFVGNIRGLEETAWTVRIT